MGQTDAYPRKICQKDIGPSSCLRCYAANYLSSGEFNKSTLPSEHSSVEPPGSIRPGFTSVAYSYGSPKRNVCAALSNSFVRHCPIQWRVKTCSSNSLPFIPMFLLRPLVATSYSRTEHSHDQIADWWETSKTGSSMNSCMKSHPPHWQDKISI